jgi:phosphate transport system permease protein
VSTERNQLVVDRGTGSQRVAALVAGVGILLVVASVVLLFQLVDATDTVAGVVVADAVGGALALSGAGLLGIGGASRGGLVETTPSRTTGVVVAAGFGLVGAVAGGLTASQTFGVATLWPLAALAAGVVVALATALPREDVGSTLPSGGLALVAGTVVLLDAVGPGWRWQPIPGSATVPGEVAVAALSLLGGLVVAWGGARAYDGFGTRGRQAGAHLLVSINAAAMVALLVALVLFVLSRGWEPMTRGVRLGLFTEPVFWFYAPPLGEWVVVEAPGVWFYWPFAMEGTTLTNEVNGVAPAIVGTVWLVVGAVAFAVPLGVGAAVFLTEYAEQGRFTRLVEVATNGLWSTPSIVYGLFGLALLVPRIGNSRSIVTGQLVLGFMLLPLVVITSREALKSVPDEYRDASAALGVGKWETIRSVVIPAAMPGVITGVILGVGRIAGETAPILLVTAGEPFPGRGPAVFGSFRFTPTFPFVDLVDTGPLFEPASALPYQLYAVITAGVGENLAFGWATALVLLLVVLGFYAVGIASRIYFRRKLQA